MAGMLAVSVEGLTKFFGRVRALDGLDLEVRTGEVHGFLGPNGAGKTTALRILFRLLQVHGRRAVLLGEIRGATPSRCGRHCPVVSTSIARSSAWWPRLQAKDRIVGAIRSGPHAERAHVLQGQSAEGRGLDVMEAAFRQCVEEERRPQRTGLLSSHLSGGRRSCDRVTIIRDRRAMEAGALSELRHLTARRSRRSSSGSAASLAGVQLVVGVIGGSVRIRCEVDSGQLTQCCGISPRPRYAV